MIECGRCRYFLPDSANPTAAMGHCMADARHGGFYPNEKHPCKDFSDTPDIRRQQGAQERSGSAPMG